MALVRRRYGLGFRGFVSSIKKYLAPPDVLTGDSRDWVLSPKDGRWLGRLGSQIQGDTRHAPVGLLESRWAARPRHLTQLKSASLTDGLPTHAVLFTNESSKIGTIYVRSTNSGGSNYQVGKEFGTTHYPETQSEPINFKMVPIPYKFESPSLSAVGMTRAINDSNRRTVFAGSRKIVQGGEWLFGPNLYSSPVKWNRRWNDSTSTGTEPLRVQLWGVTPPLYPPTQGTEEASTSSSDRNWKDGDAFYASVAFIMEDGSISMPFRIRPTSTDVDNTKGAAKGGLFVIGTIQTSSPVTYKRSVLWKDIAKGPPGCRARLLLRTNKVNLSVFGTASAVVDGGNQTMEEIDTSILYPVTLIEDNTTTEYVDENGIEIPGLRDDLVVRNDRVFPPPCRYAWEMDQRVVIGYRRAHLGALIVAPTGKTVSRDLNGDDTVDTGVDAYGVRVTSGTFRLVREQSFGFGATTNTFNITIGSGVTLQQLIDRINATTVVSSAGEWAAQAVPGADLQASTDNLIQTTFNVSGCSLSSTTLTTTTTDGFRDAAVGMRFLEGISGTDTFVESKASNTSMTVRSAGSVDFSNRTGTFHIDTGDFAISAQRFNRTFNNALPIVVPWLATYIEGLPGYENKQTIMFTQGTRGLPGGGSENFVVANIRQPPPADNAGILMGGAPLPTGSIVCYSNAIYTLENRAEGNTGDDIDYHLFPLNVGRGCLAWDSITHGDGWVGYMTRDGYVVTDGQREVIISGDVWDPATKEGEWAYEITQSAKGAEADDDSSHFHAYVFGGQLHVTYRSSAADSPDEPNRRLIYDFSDSIEGSGLAEVLRPDGTPWGWSPPLRHRHSVMGAVQKSDRRRLLGCVEDNAGTTGNGRVDEMDVPNFFYDDAEFLLVIGSWTSGLPTITGTAGAYSQIAVGAAIAPATGWAGGETVISKSSDEGTLTMSANASATTSGGIVLYGKEIEPIGYCAMDMVDEIEKKKSFQRATVVYKHIGTSPTTMTLGFSRHKNRTGRQTYSLEGHSSPDEFNRLVVQLNQDSRSPSEVGEFDFSHDGRGGARPEFYGLDTRVRILTLEE
jgi:hypothetical protein